MRNRFGVVVTVAVMGAVALLLLSSWPRRK
jgi:hypothetical protein